MITTLLAAVFATTFVSDFAELRLDDRGWTTGLVERATGRVLADGKVPFIRPVVETKGSLPVSSGFRETGRNRYVWTFDDLGSVELEITPFRGGWSYTILSMDVKGAKALNVGCIRGIRCGKWYGGASKIVSDERSGIAVRGYDLHSSAMVGGADAYVTFAPPDGCYAGMRGGIAAAPRSELQAALQGMAGDSGRPHSKAAGPWAIGSDNCGGSYLNARITEASVDDYIALAERGGFDVVHFRENWYACRGHYPVNTNDWPSGLAGMKRAVEKIHAAGLRAGLHTLTGCIDPKDDWIHPRCSRDLMAWATYTLAEPLAEGAKELVVEEKPIGKHDVTFTYHGNGNAIRIGDEIVQYTGFTTTPPYRFTGLVRGAFGTVTGAHAKGERADYLQQRYIAFYPEPDSQLAKDLAAAIGHVYNTCGFDQIYCDGTEGMMTRYGQAKMRDLIMHECTKEGRPCLSEDSCGCATEHCWWYHSRVGAWDSTFWAPKRFHEFHVGNMKRAMARERELFEIQMGWWAPIQWSPHARMHYADDMEYYASRNAGLDASMSIAGADVSKKPLNYALTEAMTILGWYERFRRAGAFVDGTRERFDRDRAEFRLRQDGADGAWTLCPVTSVLHRVAGPETAAWTVPLTAAGRGAIRVEALYGADAYDGRSAAVYVEAAKPELLEVRTAGKAVTLDVGTAEDPARGTVLRLCGRNAGTTSRGAWACAVRSYSPYRDANRRVVACWVKGDGSGATLNVQVKTPREYGEAMSEHYVKLDFTGWRYFAMPFRETDVEQFAEYQWPYRNYSEVFHRLINGNFCSEVSHWLNEIPAKGGAEVQVTDVKFVNLADLAFGNATLTVNGRGYPLPFGMACGQFAELDGGFWTLFEKTGEPVLRRPAPDLPDLVAGANAFSFTAETKVPGQPVRVEVNCFALGAPAPALKPFGGLTAQKRRFLDYEAVAPGWYDPENGFGELPPIMVRPGERAAVECTVYGPSAPFTLSVGTLSASIPAIGEGERRTVRFDGTVSGRVPVGVSAPSGKPAKRYEFAKRYVR